MTGYRQQKPKIGLTKCPDLVDHYNLAECVFDCAASEVVPLLHAVNAQYGIEWVGATIPH